MNFPWSFAKRLICFQHSLFSIFVTYLYWRSLYITCICTCTYPACIFTATFLPLFWGGGVISGLHQSTLFAIASDTMKRPFNITSKHQHNEICRIYFLHPFRDSVQHYAKVERTMLTKTVWHSEAKELMAISGLGKWPWTFWSKIHQDNFIAVRSARENQDWINEQFYSDIYMYNVHVKVDTLQTKLNPFQTKLDLFKLLF